MSSINAATFIDYENVFYHLKHEYEDPPEPTDAVLAILRNFRTKLEGLGFRPIIETAYGDFERLKAAPQGGLYLMGIDTQYVLGTEHKNAADMRLCIDALECLYTRPEIGVFVIVAGDRDYIPVIQHLKRQAREVYVLAFRKSTSGDLLGIVGESNFFDAEVLLGEDRRRRLEQHRADALAAKEPPPPPVPVPVGLKYTMTHATTQFEKPQKLRTQEELTCLQVLLENYGQHTEVFLTPWLHRLREALPMLMEYERKQLVADLETAGVIRIERRKGEPNDFSVAVINVNHMDVRSLYPFEA